MKTVMKDIFSKIMFDILINYMNFVMNYHFYLSEVKVRIEKFKMLVANLHDKTEYAIHRRNQFVEKSSQSE